VIASSERKSVSVEETYAVDLADLAACQAELPTLFASLQGRMQRAQAEQCIQKLYVKIRFADFHQTTVECRGCTLDAQVFADLLETGYLRANQPVRLIGLGTRLADQREETQLSLFAA
jgi:DNA polymerase-4